MTPHLTLSMYLEPPQSNNYCERCWDECETFFHDRFCARCTEVSHDDPTPSANRRGSSLPHPMA